MKLLSLIFGAAPAAAPPPAAIVLDLPAAPSLPAALPAPEAAWAAHGAEAVLDEMVRAFQAGLVAHGCERAAMADALLALRWADLRTADFAGPGKRRASAKAQRRFRAVIDRLILEGAGDGIGWRDADGRPFA